MPLRYKTISFRCHYLKTPKFNLQLNTRASEPFYWATSHSTMDLSLRYKAQQIMLYNSHAPPRFGLAARRYPA